MATLPPRRVDDYATRRKSRAEGTNTKGERALSLENLERETSLELATSTLARLRSTN